MERVLPLCGCFVKGWAALAEVRTGTGPLPSPLPQTADRYAELGMSRVRTATACDRTDLVCIISGIPGTL